MKVPKKFPFSNRQAVLELADQYWHEIRSDEREEEGLIESRIEAERARGYLDKETFLLIAGWKSKRPKKRHVLNSASRVRASTEKAFSASTDNEAISALAVRPLKLDGVRLRTATALLHWMRPNDFPILDIRVVRALREAAPSNWDDIRYYERIAERCRKAAGSLGIDLRTLDRAMWTWDKLTS